MTTKDRNQQKYLVEEHVKVEDKLAYEAKKVGAYCFSALLKEGGGVDFTQNSNLKKNQNLNQNRRKKKKHVGIL